MKSDTIYVLLFSAFSTTGIFMVEFIEYFEASKLYVSLISSLMMAMVAVVGEKRLLPFDFSDDMWLSFMISLCDFI